MFFIIPSRHIVRRAAVIAAAAGQGSARQRDVRAAPEGESGGTAYAPWKRYSFCVLMVISVNRRSVRASATSSARVRMRSENACNMSAA